MPGKTIGLTNVAAMLGLVMMACGGGDSGTRLPGIVPTQSGPASTGGGDQGSATGGGGGSADGTNTAMVTVGNDRYELADFMCLHAGPDGIATVILGDPQVVLYIPEEGSDIGSGRFDLDVQVIGGGRAWQANATTAEISGAASGVDEYTFSGSWPGGWTASGSATFYDQDAGETATGTFEITCASGLAETADENTAVLTIGDERHEFERLWCRTFFGAVTGHGIVRGTELDIELMPPALEDPSTVRLSFENGKGWEAELDDFTLEGDRESGFRATGSATFTERGVWDGTPGEASGTLELSCGRLTS